MDEPIVLFDPPTPNPELEPHQLERIRERVLTMRNLLNEALEEAAMNGIEVEVRLIPAMMVGAARLGITRHHLVEALPTPDTALDEQSERIELARLKHKYENRT